MERTLAEKEAREGEVYWVTLGRAALSVQVLIFISFSLSFLYLQVRKQNLLPLQIMSIHVSYRDTNNHNYLTRNRDGDFHFLKVIS